MTVTSVGSQTLRTLLDRGKGASPSCRTARTLSHCNLDWGLHSHHRKGELASVSSGSSRIWPSGDLVLGLTVWVTGPGHLSIPETSCSKGRQSHCCSQRHPSARITPQSYIQELFVNIPSETESVFTRVGTSTKSV